MSNEKPKVSGIILITKPEYWQYPIGECIKSWSAILDEIIIVDGTKELEFTVVHGLIDIEKKIKFVYSNWPDDWDYSQLTKNFNVGLRACSGDVVLKIDADWILSEVDRDNFKEDCQNLIENNKFTLSIGKKNFILKDKYYIKSRRTLGVNKQLCEKFSVPLRIGMDLKRNSWGNDFIVNRDFQHDINFGELIRRKGTDIKARIDVFNYDNVFRTLERARELRKAFLRAETKQKMKEYTFYSATPEHDLNAIDDAFTERWMKTYYLATLKKNEQYPMPIEKHPKIIQDRLRALTPEQQGHNCWGWV